MNSTTANGYCKTIAAMAAGQSHEGDAAFLPSRSFLGILRMELVGTGRFELPTPRTPSECSTRLSHVPTSCGRILLSRLLGSWSSLHRCGCAVENALRYSVFDSALDRMHNAKWLFPIRGPHQTGLRLWGGGPGSPQTGLRLWGGSKSHLARCRRGQQVNRKRSNAQAERTPRAETSPRRRKTAPSARRETAAPGAARAAGGTR